MPFQPLDASGAPLVDVAEAPTIRDSRQEIQVVGRYQERLLEGILTQMKIMNLILLQIAGLAGVPIRSEDFATELFQEGRT